MLTADELTSLREVAEDVMVDTCVISRVTGTTFDPNTGTETPTTATVYSGACQLRIAGNMASDALFGGENVTIRPFTVAVPHDTTDIELEDRIVVTSTWDGTAVTRDLRAVSIPSRTFNLSRSIGCEVVES